MESFDVNYITARLCRYGHSSKKKHFKAALRVFGYIRAYEKARIEVDRPLNRETKGRWMD